MAIGDVTSSSYDGPKVWEKRVTDGRRQTVMDAPEIGALRNDYARLNIVGKLDAKDKEDVYRFNVTNTGKMSLNLQTESQLRIQIMTLNGRILADSDEGAGTAFDTFTAMSNGTYEGLQPGHYAVKVSWAKGATPEATDYALQMKLGDAYPNDYVTWESQESTKPEIPQPVIPPIVDIFSGFIKSIREMFS